MQEPNDLRIWNGQSASAEAVGIAALPRTASQADVAERIKFIQKVYALFFGATLFAIGGVVIGVNSPSLMILIAEHYWISLLLMVLGVIGTQKVRHESGLNVVVYYCFTAFTGLIISPMIFYVGIHNPAAIVEAGVLTVGIFGGLTLYVFTSKKDFSFLRGMVTVGLIVLVLGGFLNILLVGSTALGFSLAMAAVVLFAGYVLYDTSNIIRRYPTSEYIAASMDLYLDVLNIFMALLRILGGGRR